MLKRSFSEDYFKEECYAIQGAIFEVYKNVGTGFLESVYQECLEIEFGMRNIPYRAQNTLNLSYKGRRLLKTYVPDFICYDKIIVELKAISALGEEHKAQALNYLKATGFSLALLVNFGHYPKVEIKRLRSDSCVSGGDTVVPIYNQIDVIAT